jgi:hypothetical protein
MLLLYAVYEFRSAPLAMCVCVYCGTALSCRVVLGGVLDVKKVGRAPPRTGGLFSGVEKWISGFH